LFLGDAELLGRLARPGGDDHEMRHQLVSRAYFDLLAEHGVLRRDLSAEAITYGFLATLEGFVRGEATDQRPGPDLQQRSELLAFTIQRAFESGKRVSAAAAKTITTRIIGLLTDMAEADLAELDTAAEKRRDEDRESETP
jgi:hypothetical protein